MAHLDSIVERLLERLAAMGASVESVRRHGLAPLAYRFGDPRFKEDFAFTCLMAERLARCMGEVITGLDAAGVPAVVLKGMSYVDYLYRTPGERPMSDIDLLVRPTQHVRAQDELRRLGFSVPHQPGAGTRLHHAVTLRRGVDVIDLHRNMAQPIRTKIDLDRVWSTASPCERTGAWRLDPVHEALFHFVHIARTQGYAPAINYVDGALLLARMTPDEVADLQSTAKQYRVRRAVQFSIALTKRVTDPPPEASGPFLMPSGTEILQHNLPSRAVQVARKLMLLDSPARAIGFLGVACIERLAPPSR